MSPVSHPTKTFVPHGDHVTTDTGPGAVTNPIGSRSIPFPGVDRKNTAPSTDPVASVLPLGEYAVVVTSSLCGFTQSTKRHPSAHRRRTRTTPSSYPAMTHLPVRST